MKKVNDENVDNVESEEDLEQPSVCKLIAQYMGLSVLGGCIVFGGYSAYQAYHKVEDYRQERQWMTEGIKNCVIYKKDTRMDGLQVYKIILQSSYLDRSKYRAFFYDEKGNKHLAEINIDPIDGLSYITRFDDGSDIWVTFNSDRTCHVVSFTQDSKTLFSKDGYMGFSTDFNSLGDWEFAKEMSDLNKKI